MKCSLKPSRIQQSALLIFCLAAVATAACGQADPPLSEEPDDVVPSDDTSD
ncbi:MAG: hypothetical protein RJA70_4428, partial [Pseudomonadota bacterium]